MGSVARLSLSPVLLRLGSNTRASDLQAHAQDNLENHLLVTRLVGNVSRGMCGFLDTDVKNI